MKDKRRYSMLVLSNPVEGREKEYLDWYAGQHIHDLLGIPEFCGCRFYKVDDLQMYGTGADQKYKYLMLWDWETDDLAALYQDMAQRKADGRSVICPAFKEQLNYVYTPITRYLSAAEVEGLSVEEVLKKAELTESSPYEGVAQPLIPGRSHSMLVFSNPVSPEVEEEYKRWYAGQHIHDLLRVPGFVGCRFYKVVEPQFIDKAEDKPYRFMIIWDWQTDSLTDMFIDIAQRKADGRTVFSPAFNRNVGNIICAPATEYIRKEDVVGMSADEVSQFSRLLDHVKAI